MKLNHIINDGSISELANVLVELDTVRSWLKDVVKYYRRYEKQAKSFNDADIITALGGKSKMLTLYRRGKEPRKVAAELAKQNRRKR